MNCLYTFLHRFRENKKELTFVSSFCIIYYLFYNNKLYYETQKTTTKVNKNPVSKYKQIALIGDFFMRINAEQTQLIC